MNKQPNESINWHAGTPAWGPAIIAGLGCALPLLLGLSTAHSGFLWASAGAFLAGQANPLHRFGMLRMLLLTGLGACSAGLGFWAAGHPLASLAVFACFGLLLAWLQRFGNEAGKAGIVLSICLCLGQGQHGIGNLHNPYAVAVLFMLGGLWVMLLAFGLRGLHGLRMWPYMPRFISILQVLKRHAQRQPKRQWRLHALTCMLAFAAAAALVSLADLSRGYWLTLMVIGTLHLQFQSSFKRTLQASLASLTIAGLLILLGHGLQDPAMLVMILLLVVIFSRAVQANHYGLYVLQTTFCFVLLSESLARDWDAPEIRLLNALLGVALALAVALLTHGLRLRLSKTQGAEHAPEQP